MQGVHSTRLPSAACARFLSRVDVQRYDERKWHTWLVHNHETNSGMGAISRKSPFLCTNAGSDTTDTSDTSDTTDTNDTNLFGSPLACLPHPYIIGHRSDTLPIWRPGERTDDSVMTAIGEDLAPGSCLPHLYRRIP
jgi:hypothetical protein